MTADMCAHGIQVPSRSSESCGAYALTSTGRVTQSVKLRLGYTEKRVGKKKRGAGQFAVKYKTETTDGLKN